jgi:CBS domain-containing protein
MKTAGDIMQKDVITVDKDESLSRVIGLIGKHKITKFPVLERGKLVGIISDEEIVSKLGEIRTRLLNASTLKISSCTLKDVKPISPDSTLKEIEEICKHRQIGLLPVIESGKLKGVITKADLLKFVDSDKPVGEFMEKNVVTALPNQSLMHARRLIIDKNIERLPIVVNGAIVGIISSMDLALFLAYFKDHVPVKYQTARFRNVTIEDAMRREVITCRPDTTARDAAKIMDHKNVGCLPVIGNNDTIRGIISRTDLINLF